ncbi:hypothetical protein [uncultured Clostridium sp.]|uniref:hypothetical protein n=1 Tax=uncultured Clostridium sp. TaxID=59620 RepID=UPI0025F74251|nr:hypothetical protein [uncultured Clostridium sp.]
MINKALKIAAVVDLVMFIIFSIIFVEFTAINETSLFILIILIIVSIYGATKLIIIYFKYDKSLSCFFSILTYCLVVVLSVVAMIIIGSLLI